MDVKHFISSGIIEMYASGLASDEEVQRLEAAMQNSTEVQRAVEACLHDMESYVLLQAVPPPPALREAVLRADLSAVDLLPLENSATGNGFVHPDADTQPATVGMVSDHRWMYAAAAVFLLLLGSVALNFVYINRYHTVLQQQQEQLVQVAKADNNMQVLETRYTSMQQEMDLLRSPSTQVIKLAGTPAHSGMMAMVYWNNKSNEVYFNGSQLPAPAAGKQYQLWAIVAGKPVDAGMFNSARPSVQQMKAIANATMFAITLENEGGSPTPTMDQMYVAGKVSV